MAKKKKVNKDTKKYQKWRARVDYKNALREWSKLVQQRDNNRCVVCESLGIIKSDHIQSHHILDKRYYKEISTDINVGITLCVHHHKWSKFAAHTNTVWFTSWLLKHRPVQHQWCLEHVDFISNIHQNEEIKSCADAINQDPPKSLDRKMDSEALPQPNVQ